MARICINIIYDIYRYYLIFIYQARNYKIRLTIFSYIKGIFLYIVQLHLGFPVLYLVFLGIILHLLLVVVSKCRWERQRVKRALFVELPAVDSVENARKSRILKTAYLMRANAAPYNYSIRATRGYIAKFRPIGGQFTVRPRHPSRPSTYRPSPLRYLQDQAPSPCTAQTRLWGGPLQP